ncbi:hypothetical protein BGY98DRAFT_982932 [Russula aff. rugulosa BPL654]|nr:hypothetical protein BGY98DRAFT_982932 [Russula aff. rugulosa BPL654]
MAFIGVTAILRGTFPGTVQVLSPPIHYPCVVSESTPFCFATFALTLKVYLYALFTSATRARTAHALMASLRV